MAHPRCTPGIRRLPHNAPGVELRNDGNTAHKKAHTDRHSGEQPLFPLEDLHS
jgi:hypothetical protein